MSKPGKVLKKLCKKLGIRLTVKRGKKRVYKSIKVLKAQCKRKKKKKVKRKRRKFGSVSLRKIPSLQEMAAKKIAENMNFDDYKNLEYDPDVPPLSVEYIKEQYLLRALKQEYTAEVIYMLKNNVRVWLIEIVIKSVFKEKFMRRYNLTGDQYDKLVKTQNINVQQIKNRLERLLYKSARKIQTVVRGENARRQVKKLHVIKKKERQKKAFEKLITQRRMEMWKRKKEALLKKLLKKEKEDAKKRSKEYDEKLENDWKKWDEQHKKDMEDLDLRKSQKRSLYDIITGGPWQPKAMLAGSLVGGTGLGLYYHSLKERDRKMAAELKSKNKKKKKIVKRKRKK